MASQESHLTAGSCGVPHPRIEGMVCTRWPCVEYHSHGSEVWTDEALSKPPRSSDPLRMVAFLRAFEERNRLR